MRPRIYRIELNGTFREFERRLCGVKMAEQARVNKMLYIVHLHEAAVARRECGVFPYPVTEDGDRALPAFRIVFEMQTLPAQPAVMYVERNVRLARQPH